MKKKILLGICTFALLLGLTACGSKEEVTYGGYTESDFQQTLEQYMSSLESIGESDLDGYISYYESNGEKVTYEALSNWKECYAEKGDFVKYSDFVLDKSGKTLTATLTSDYTGRDIKLIFVFNVNHMDEGPTAINIEPVYTLGETMAKAGMNTVMGIMIVFVMLVVMSLIISCFRFIPAITDFFAGNKKAEEKPATKEVVAETASAGTDDLQLIAVIAAAIAASTGASTDSFVVRSIKKRR